MEIDDNVLIDTFLQIIRDPVLMLFSITTPVARPDRSQMRTLSSLRPKHSFHRNVGVALAGPEA